jgi:putative membrane protein
MIGIRFYKKIRAKKSWDKFEKELIEEDEKFNN